MGIALVVMYAILGIFGPRTPRLGIDLQGGSQVTLTAQGNQQITTDKMNTAVDIIRDRVNAFGVSEAQVNTQGNNNIVVSLPGKNQQSLLDQIGSPAMLNFRVVLLCAAAGAPATTPSTTPTTTPTTGSTPAAGTTPAAATQPTTPGATPTATQARAIPQDLLATTATPGATQPVAATTPAAATGPATTPSPATSTAAPVTGPSQCYSPLQQDTGSPPSYAANLVDPAAAAGQTYTVPADVYQRFEAAKCSDPSTLEGYDPTTGKVNDPNPHGDQEVVACDSTGATKFLLARAAVHGTDVTSADARLTTDSQGNSTGAWQVVLNLKDPGKTAFASVTNTLSSSQQQFAIALDNVVQSAPTVNQPITTGQAEISGGSINADSARSLANILKYGALPVTFTPQNAETISPTLAGSQLTGGLLAGAIGLVLVVLYAFFYYRGLAVVALLSLAVAAALTYAIAVLLGPIVGFTLSLPGVAGLVVAIGITADSFIVYFERIRDEVREGRSLRTAIEHGWTRARRTILVADFVSFLAAFVLYIVSIDQVRGFAFTLGLTTLIDVVVVFLFTKPLITILARTEFFGGGHRWSGLDPARLGRVRPQSVVRRRQSGAKEA